MKAHEGKALESVGAHFSRASWRDHEGGYVGNATWRDGYGMATTSYCGHRHRLEEAARECIRAKLSREDPGALDELTGGDR